MKSMLFSPTRPHPGGKKGTLMLTICILVLAAIPILIEVAAHLGRRHTS